MTTTSNATTGSTLATLDALAEQLWHDRQQLDPAARASDRAQALQRAQADVDGAAAALRGGNSDAALHQLAGARAALESAGLEDAYEIPTWRQGPQPGRISVSGLGVMPVARIRERNQVTAYN